MATASPALNLAKGAAQIDFVTELNCAIDPINKKVSDKVDLVTAWNAEKIKAVSESPLFNQEIDRIQSILNNASRFGQRLPDGYKLKMCDTLRRTAKCPKQETSCLDAHSVKVQYAANLLKTPAFRSIYCANRSEKHVHPDADVSKFAHHGDLMQTNYDPTKIDHSNSKSTWDIAGKKEVASAAQNGTSAPTSGVKTPRGTIGHPLTGYGTASTSSTNSSLPGSASSSAAPSPSHALFASAIHFDFSPVLTPRRSSSVSSFTPPDKTTELDSSSSAPFSLPQNEPFTISLLAIGESIQRLSTTNFHCFKPKVSPRQSVLSSDAKKQEEETLPDPLDFPSFSSRFSIDSALSSRSDTPVETDSSVPSRSETPSLLLGTQMNMRTPSPLDTDSSSSVSASVMSPANLSSSRDSSPFLDPDSNLSHFASLALDLGAANRSETPSSLPSSATESSNLLPTASRSSLDSISESGSATFSAAPTTPHGLSLPLRSPSSMSSADSYLLRSTAFNHQILHPSLSLVVPTGRTADWDHEKSKISDIKERVVDAIERDPKSLAFSVHAFERGNQRFSLNQINAFRTQALEVFRTGTRIEDKDEFSPEFNNWKYVIEGPIRTGGHTMRIVFTFVDGKTHVVSFIKKPEEFSRFRNK